MTCFLTDCTHKGVAYYLCFNHFRFRPIRKTKLQNIKKFSFAILCFLNSHLKSNNSSMKQKLYILII